MNRTSENIREEIAAVDNDLRLIYTRAKAARLAVEHLRKTAVMSVAFFRGGEDLDRPANNVAPVLAFARSDSGRDLAAATAVLAVLEAEPSLSEARSILDPLVAELEAATERELAAAHEQRMAEVALEAAEQAARVKFEAKIATDPAVTKARQALAGIKRLGEPLDLDRELAADFH